jgi:hypothetical protein
MKQQQETDADREHAEDHDTSNAGDRLTLHAMRTDRHRFRSRRLMCPGEHDRVRHHAEQNEDHEGQHRARADRRNTGNLRGASPAAVPLTISCGTAPTSDATTATGSNCFPRSTEQLEAVVEDAAQWQWRVRKFGTWLPPVLLSKRFRSQSGAPRTSPLVVGWRIFSI